MTDDTIRPGEIAVQNPKAHDAGLVFIGRIHTPFLERAHCPRQGTPEGPLCEVEVFPPWDQALLGLEEFDRIEVLYWLHQSRRDLVLQAPGRKDSLRGTFSLRSPVRPNPIGTSLVTLVARRGPRLMVRGLDCLDGTPLLDVKPDRCAYTPLARERRDAER